jgi:hypothetical protein
MAKEPSPEARLAEPGRRLDKYRLPVPPRGLGQRNLDLGELALAFKSVAAVGVATAGHSLPDSRITRSRLPRCQLDGLHHR